MRGGAARLFPLVALSDCVKVALKGLLGVALRMRRKVRRSGSAGAEEWGLPGNKRRLQRGMRARTSATPTNSRATRSSATQRSSSWRSSP